MPYRSIDAWPAERTKRSRFGQTGDAGSNRRDRCQSVYVTGAAPMTVPGGPESAACTASMPSVRIVLTQSWSSDCVTAFVLLALPAVADAGSEVVVVMR